ncbi:MAG: hypothetical protein AB1752_14350 [Candidatus Zixiibacteriota bacterium]
MPQTTMGFDLYHSGSPRLNENLRAGNTLAHKLLPFHMIQGYADNRSAAGGGVMWRVSLPYLVWARGLSTGAISCSPTTPGISYMVDDSYLIRNYGQIQVARVW